MFNGFISLFFVAIVTCSQAFAAETESIVLAEGENTKIMVVQTGLERDASGLLTEIKFEIQNSDDQVYSILTDERIASLQSLFIISDGKFVKEPEYEEYKYVPHPLTLTSLQPGESIQKNISIAQESGIELEVLEKLDVVDIHATLIVVVYPDVVDTDHGAVLEQITGRSRLTNIEMVEK